MSYKVCPLCRGYVKTDEKGKFVQHNKYLPRSGTWAKETCSKSGKKA